MLQKNCRIQKENGIKFYEKDILFDDYVFTNNIEISFDSQNEITNTENKIKELKETRRLKALDPYAKEAIQDLTEQIRKTEHLLEKYQEDVRNSTIELEIMSQNEKNLKLINILKDRTKIEAKLPSLYNQQKELASSVNAKYQSLRSLEKQLKNYDELTERIEALESEINN